MSHRDAARIRAISREIDVLVTERARLIGQFDSERGYELDGASGTVAWLKTECRLSAGSALEILSVARRLRELPLVQTALTGGAIGFEHAAVIAESADKLGSQVLLERQDTLVERAEAADPSDFRQEVKKVELQVDAERMKREAEWAYRSRHLKLQTWRDGRVKVDGLLDAEGGAKVRTALAAALGPRAKDEQRSEDQRRADALVEVATRALGGHKFGQTGGRVPHVNVTVELETLAGLRNNPGSLDGAGPVLYDTIERYLCDAALCFAVVHDGEVLLAGKEKRTFSGPLRRALTLKKRGCEFPGCDRPAEWCEGHHLLAFVLRGKTEPANGCLLCGFHHRLVHEGGWKVERKDGDIVAANPYGEKFRSAKAPPAA